MGETKWKEDGDWFSCGFNRIEYRVVQAAVEQLSKANTHFKAYINEAYKRKMNQDHSIGLALRQFVAWMSEITIQSNRLQKNK